jgi:hypothetical protein
VRYYGLNLTTLGLNPVAGICVSSVEPLDFNAWELAVAGKQHERCEKSEIKYSVLSFHTHTDIAKEIQELWISSIVFLDRTKYWVFW